MTLKKLKQNGAQCQKRKGKKSCSGLLVLIFMIGILAWFKWQEIPFIDYVKNGFEAYVIPNQIETKITVNTQHVQQSSKKVQQSALTKENYKMVNGIIIVNRKHRLDAHYAPGENETATLKFKQLQQKMKQLGFKISDNYSGYRSYAEQKQLYQQYVKQYGKIKAEKIVARPGYSEHQTGLAFDLFSSVNARFGTTKSDEKAVSWLQKNAHHYSFIIRYPKNKEQITGYAYEPWHLRYVGNLAEKIKQSGLTLEEYFNVEGGIKYRD